MDKKTNGNQCVILYILYYTKWKTEKKQINTKNKTCIQILFCRNVNAKKTFLMLTKNKWIFSYIACMMGMAKLQWLEVEEQKRVILSTRGRDLKCM